MHRKHWMALFFAVCLIASLLVAPVAMADQSTTNCGSGGTSSVAAPTGLKITAKTDTTATLKWTAPRSSRSIKQYNIYRGNTLVGSSTTTSFADSGLTPNTDYSWTVKAVDRYNKLSRSSNKLSAATQLIIREDTTWAADTAPASINGGLIVEAAATLTIEAGTVVKIRPCQSVTVYGTVNAGGAPDALVVFTSTADKAYGGCGVGSSGYWETIKVAAGGYFTGDWMKITYGKTLAMVYGLLALNNSEIAYAKTTGILVEAGGEFDGIGDKIHDCCETSTCRGIIAKGTVNLSQSELYDCPGTAVLVESTGNFNGSSVTIADCGKGVEVKGSVNLVMCSISGCDYGLYFNTTSFNGVIMNSFMGNNEYGVYNKRAADVTIDASMNYWGSPNGPSVFDDATKTWVGDGDRVSKGVLYDNWLVEPAQ